MRHPRQAESLTVRGFTAMLPSAQPLRWFALAREDAGNNWISGSAHYGNGNSSGRRRPQRWNDGRGAKGHLRLVARHRVRVVRLLHLRNARLLPRKILLLQRSAERWR